MIARCLGHAEQSLKLTRCERVAKGWRGHTTIDRRQRHWRSIQISIDRCTYCCSSGRRDGRHESAAKISHWAAVFCIRHRSRFGPTRCANDPVVCVHPPLGGSRNEAQLGTAAALFFFNSRATSVFFVPEFRTLFWLIFVERRAIRTV